MGWGSATLNSHPCSCFFSARRASSCTASDSFPSVSFTRWSRLSPYLAPNIRSKPLFPRVEKHTSSSRKPAEYRIPGVPWEVNPIRRQQPSVSAIADDTAAMPNDFASNQEKLLESSTATLERPIEIGDGGDEKDKHEGLDDGKMIRISDKLIEVFMVDKPTPSDWRRLLAFSREWSNIRPHFFKRCQERADSEHDPGMKHGLLRLGRKLKVIDEDVERHNELLNTIKGAPSEINEIVSKRRKDFTKEFFVHVHTVAQSYQKNPAEQNALAKLGNMALAGVQAYDTASENMEALNTAELKFQDIINSPTLDAACQKIDSLAERNQLDSALVLMITKAWSAAKESNMTKDEVKDVLYHLYVTARGNLQRQMPKEIRILKHLLMIKDPEELQCALKDAFTPGEEIEGNDFDSLYTTPEKLHTWMRSVVDAYHLSQEGTLLREARDLLNPKIIQKMEELMRLVERGFL